MSLSPAEKRRETELQKLGKNIERLGENGATELLKAGVTHVEFIRSEVFGGSILRIGRQQNRDDWLKIDGKIQSLLKQHGVSGIERKVMDSVSNDRYVTDLLTREALTQAAFEKIASEFNKLKEKNK